MVLVQSCDFICQHSRLIYLAIYVLGNILVVIWSLKEAIVEKFEFVAADAHVS